MKAVMTRWLLTGKRAVLLALVMLGGVPLLAYGKAGKVAANPTTKWFCRSFEEGYQGAGKGGDINHAVQQCVELINSGVSQHRFTYNRDIAVRCINTQSGCDEVLGGLQPAGAACESSLDCQKLLVCIGPRGGAPGHCSKPLAAGLNCDDEVGAGHFFAQALAKRSVCGPGMHCAAHEGGAQVCAHD